MLQQRIEAKWIDVFCQAFALCGVRSGESAAILSETQSRPGTISHWPGGRFLAFPAQGCVDGTLVLDADLARQLVPAMMAPDTRAALRGPAEVLMSAVSEATYRAALAAIVEFNQLANLPRIRVPTFCMAGEHDRNASPAVLRKMAEKIPAAQYACVPGVGHLANMEAPDAFNNLVLGFLQKHFPAQGEPS